jgi:hypothetical protein
LFGNSRALGSCDSISEFRRIGQIKAKVTDEQLLHLALRELPASIFAKTTDFNYGFHNQTGMELIFEEMKVSGLRTQIRNGRLWAQQAPTAAGATPCVPFKPSRVLRRIAINSGL